jgi:hypothetical protein
MSARVVKTLFVGGIAHGEVREIPEHLATYLVPVRVSVRLHRNAEARNLTLATDTYQRLTVTIGRRSGVRVMIHERYLLTHGLNPPMAHAMSRALGLNIVGEDEE